MQRRLVIIYSDDPNLRVKVENKIKALRFLARANELLVFGNIEMNFEEYNFRFKTIQDFQGI